MAKLTDIHVDPADDGQRESLVQLGDAIDRIETAAASAVQALNALGVPAYAGLVRRRAAELLALVPGKLREAAGDCLGETYAVAGEIPF